MRNLILPALLLLGGAGAASYCPIRAVPVQTLGVSYKISLRLDPTCKPGDVARFRKTSTLSTKAQGHRVQPVFPNGTLQYRGLWSWTMTRSGTNMPAAEAWTLLSWRWEYWEPDAWNALTRTYGAWMRARS